MEAGDAAAAVGLPIVSGTTDLRESFIEHNTTRDIIAGQMTDGTFDASAIVSGVLNSARLSLDDDDIPNLPASKITSGTFSSSRIPSYLQADTVTSNALSRNGSGSAPWYSVWMNSDRQLMRNTSSKRYKKNIRTWGVGLAAILNLRAVIFDRRGDNTPDNEVGFIAEEVNEHIPEAVVYFDDKIDGITDRPIIAALVVAIQELSERVIALEQDKENTP